ncbi:hypothetical protein K432DRAFT_403557 [Lepidopterella palustris CBS 459.81]|uniref:Uncharacterized protein n=1 Tax=Lepidopterella palustris CBS 459.81 TaxID=1314670 RepID=A0A8E2ECZ5_9PEZI|nr:hypothetical protein K432DRAFT_403557 [Lepidopterella palustris CBS 459.81]
MKGLWALKVHLTGTSFKGNYELARIIIDIIFFVAIIYAWTRQPAREKKRKAYHGIIYSADILLAWYLLTLIDLFLHEARLNATYGYILFYFFIACLKFAADFLILAGTHRVTSGLLFYQIKKAKIWHLVGEFIIIVLMITALYYLGSLLADEILWLQVADSDAIQSVNTRKNKLEAAFVILQFFLTLMTLAATMLSAWIYLDDDSEIPRQSYIAVAATGTLWIRSFSELVIVLRYDLLQHAMPKGTPIARDVIYGLCTVVFLILMAIVQQNLSAYEASHPIEAQIEEDSRVHLIGIVNAAAAAGEQLPAVSAAIATMRGNSRNALSDLTKQDFDNLRAAERTRLQQLHLDYLNRLDQKYGHMAPVDRTREI